MSNAIQHTEHRSMRLLLVVLMASVGLALVGCGKSKGQVVGGPPAHCEGDCQDDKKPFSGEPWLTALGTGSSFKLGVDFYDVSGKGAGAQGIEVVPAKTDAAGTLWVYSGNFCGLSSGEYHFAKAKKVGSIQLQEFKLPGYSYYPDYYNDTYAYYVIQGFEFEAVSKSGKKVHITLGGSGPYGWGPVTAFLNAYPKKGPDGWLYDFSLYGPLIVNGNCYL